jgi:hypothetical protein
VATSYSFSHAKGMREDDFHPEAVEPSDADRERRDEKRAGVLDGIGRQLLADNQKLK